MANYKGYNHNTNNLKSLKLLDTISLGGSILPLTNEYYNVILNVSDGIFIFNEEYTLISTIEKYEGTQLFPVILFEHSLFLINSYLEKSFRFDIPTKRLIEISYDNFFGGGTQIGNKHISGRLNELRCFNLQESCLDWETQLQMPIAEVVSDGKNLFISENNHKSVVKVDLRTHQIKGQFTPPDYKELDWVDTIGRISVVNDEIICHSLPPMEKIQDHNKSGIRRWYSISLDLDQINWFLDVENPSINSTYADNRNCSISFEGQKKGYVYNEIDFVKGVMVKSFEINNQLNKISSEFKINTKNYNYLFGAPIVTDDYFLFGFGTCVVCLSRENGLLNVIHYDTTSYNQSLINLNKLFVTTADYRTLVFG